MLDVAVRAGNRAKLEVLGRVAPLGRRAAHAYEARVAAHRPHLAPLPAHRGALADVVRAEGTCVSTLEELALPGTAALQSGLDRLQASLAAQPAGTADTLRPPLLSVLAEQDVWQWGLGHELLDLVEAHLGVPARYYGADLRLERANARSVGVRQWHRDVEDQRMFKVLVWLNDVDTDGGPFQYVSGRHTARLTRELAYVSGFVSDDRLDSLVPRSQWLQATGPRWTAVLADTRAVFHRAMPPVARDRYSVTFSYTSREPSTTLPVPPATPAQRALAGRGLDNRQRACLPRQLLR